MLKCPHCGARVKGPDLLTGICSACQQRLSTSIDSLSMDDREREGTAASDASASAPEGSSLASDVPESQEAPLRTLLSDNFGGGFDVVQPSPAPAANVLRDRDTGDIEAARAGSGSVAGDDAQGTLASADLPSASVSEAASGDDRADRTLVTEVPPLIDAEAALKTVNMDADSAADAEAGMKTIGMDGVAAMEQGDRTIVTDGDASLVAADRTIVGESLMQGEGGEDKTFVSDDVPEDLIRTVQSEWGDAGDESRPQATLKGRERGKPRSTTGSLVIKTKTLREAKLGPASDALPNPQFDAEYELIRVLGEGGMGVVFDARQTSIDRNVAVKMIKGSAAENEKQKAKFLAEAVVTGDLDHPNIVPIYDVGADEKGALFYSMKKVVGTPWDKVIRKKSLTENLEILMKVADAVAFAHARGVIHRDLKPENTMLGEFGEVLVMDWGLAQPSHSFRKASSITETSSMGGTPAYMAPEMATGPLEKISFRSDVYLLGAILYEIVTGTPPHQGKNAMKCLMAAARNEIVPTEKTGELVDIALKAMATDPKDRYPDVRSFQQAIREYLSHTESITLAERAEEDFAEAVKSDDYQQYSRALFGFQEAYELWQGNKRALAGIGRVQQAYADSALRKGDFDLGLSLLDAANPDHQPLRQRLLAEKQEREARKSRIAALKRMGMGLAAAFVVVVTGAAIWINHERSLAIQARDEAVIAQRQAVAAQKEEAKAKEEAVAARDQAVAAARQEALARAEEQKAKEAAIAAEKVAVAEREKAELARQQAELARQQAELAREEEEKAKEQAVAARDQAIEARRQAEIAKQKEEYEAYIAQIGLAAAKIDENAFDTARELLLRCKPELRHWEWGRLMHLCSQSSRTFKAEPPAPLDALAISPDGNWFATGGWDGAARIWNRETGEVRHVLQHGGLYVHSVAFSPDSRLLATGGDDPQGYVQVWDVATGRRLRTITGHEDGVLSVVFSRDGQRLLSASYDKTARLWSLADGREIKAFRGHTWWVWQAVFSPAEDRLVTVSQDGTAIVWDVDSDRPSPPFTGHRGPVYCAAFSRDGKTVVTGGYDHRILAWRPDDLRPYNFRNLEKGTAVVPSVKFRELDGHATSIRSLSFSPDGRLLLSGAHDNTVRLWEFETGSILQTFRGHDSWVRQCVFVPGGRFLLSASHDNTVREWSIAGYEELRSLQGRRLEGHADAILAAAFSPNQQLVVTASRDRTARVWDVQTAEEKIVLEEGHAFLASTAQFFDHGRKLVTAAVDNTARVWDVATGTQLHRFDRTGRAAVAVVSSDERWLLTGGTDKQAQLWDLATGDRVREYPGHASEVTAAAFSPDGIHLVTADAKGRAVLWNGATGERLREFRGHTRRINAVAFLADGAQLITASGDKTVSRWDIATGQELKGAVLRHPDSVLALAVTADGKTAVTSCGDRQVRVWDLEASAVQRTLGPFAGLVYSLAVSADGARLLTAHAEERVARLWDVATGQELTTPRGDGSVGSVVDLRQRGGLLWAAAFAPGGDVLTVGGSDARLWDVKTGRERISFSPHGAVASARFSPDNQWVVTGSWDNSAKIWDVATGRAVLKLEGGHEGFVNSAVFSPDGRYVLTAGDDGAVVLWDVRLTGPDGAPATQIVKTIRAHDDRVRFANFSANGAWVITTSNDKTARLWNAATGERIRTFSGHAWAVLSAEFSRDGKRLITGSEDNTAKVWDVDTGECLLTLAGHTAPVASVAFAPDGFRVLTGSLDQAAKLWDAQTGKEILTLSRHTADVTSVAFSPDGKQVLTGSRDGTAVIWLAIDWRNPLTAALAPEQP
uniref:Serine/threonine protein kinase n=1 Tax=Schlesneria paludicola TaxID=360056 RepID=A0A7C4QLF4_9PLAN